MTTTLIPQDFAGRRALVTGAGSGIGLQIVTQLRERGADVIGVDLRPDDLPEGVVRIACDVSDPEQVRAAAAEALALGPIDTLFNNAGVGSVTDVLQATVDEWDRVFDVNVRAIFLMCQHLLPGMLDRGYGVIVNTASVGGHIGLKNRASYCASKGAVITLTKQIAVQWAASGIRCNSVSPGTVDSPWVGRLLAGADDPHGYREELIARQPMGRLGRPEEIAAAALYLASDAAAYVTGTDLIIDGGIYAG